MVVGRRGRLVAGLAALTLACGVIIAASSRPPAQPSLALAGIAQDPCRPPDVLAVPAGVKGWYLPGSSVLRTSAGIYAAPGRAVAVSPALAACERRAVQASRQWLAAGTIPGAPGRQRSMATRALLDLHLLIRPDGAVVAAWPSGWRYAWPRDSSWVAVALADTGHPADSFRVLRFLQRTQLPDGTWAARYWPDGAGPVRDGRPAELDATGWVPWAVWNWAAALRPGDRAGRRQLMLLWPMVKAAASAAGQSLTSDGLPAAAMDYWEDSTTVTLGTAGPLLAGLRAAADLAVALGDRADQQRWSQAAERLSGAISSAFGRYGYHRLPQASLGADAAITFLGPPFAAAGAALDRAARTAEAALTLPDGGVRPGTDWPGHPAVAWTAETAFFALLWASTGDHQRSAAILAWLAAHRTTLGELPEQVNDRGRPVSVAPLAWTDAVVLLALLAQRQHLPVPPAAAVPPGLPVPAASRARPVRGPATAAQVRH